MLKEKVKIWHDRKIKKREFKIGDRVLLYNSRFKFSAGKLVSKWQGPLIIQDIYPSGAIRFQGSMKGKPHVVNGQRLKHYYAGEKFVGKVEEFRLLSPEEIIAAESCLPETPKQ